MKTTLDKLVNKIKDCAFYRIAFDTYDEKRVWIIGEKKSYLEEIVDPDIPDYYNAHLNVRQVISISTDNKDEDKISLDVYPKLGDDVPSYEAENNHFYMFESAECIDVIDFKDFDTSDKFFEDILRNLDNVLKDKYDISIKDLNYGQYSESPFGEENGCIHGTFYKLEAYKPDMTGIEISSLLQEPLNDCGFIYFRKLDNNTKITHKNAAVSYSIVDPKDKLLSLIKKAAITTSCVHHNEIDKGCRWLEAKIK